ncbi:hypothetical protein [Mucilaginibacter sp. L196]|uniref:hypothetical protein n=1 Tax=Mucilaginibacter sp. L196 TaxID=1641870 RepID=UPI00131A6BB2|nr:hypothetical protein [Mucilaginibacter sp. L196]
MFKQFYDDLTYLPRAKFSAKYTVPFIVCFLGIVLIGQLLSMFVTVDQLDKVSGNIVNVETNIIGYTHHRFDAHDSPNYALVITLDNMQSYKIQEEKTRFRLGSILKNGDYVSIYYPTTMLKILSAGLARDVSQVERGNEVLYSWKDQQNEEWFIVGFLIVAISFFYWSIKYFRNYVPKSKFNN